MWRQNFLEMAPFRKDLCAKLKNFWRVNLRNLAHVSAVIWHDKLHPMLRSILFLRAILVLTD